MTKHHRKRTEVAMPAGHEGAPLVAIVGRPNVGKSTLFNRLARQRIAIVHDLPGVTRDRKSTATTAFGRKYTLVDTGGFDPESDDAMMGAIGAHVRAAIGEADVIVFVTDATADITAADRASVALLRQSGKPLIFAANKADAPKTDAGAFDLYQLGVDQVYAVSALHGRGIGELELAIVDAFPPESPEPTAAEDTCARVAIVGRPNAGKSSLMNRILGEERVLVHDAPGTTRDAIDVVVTRGDARYVLIDTAGIRRKGKVAKGDDTVEAVSVLHAIRSIERSHITVLLCDAGDGVAEQDAKILGLAEERGRGMIIGLNKCDLLSRQEAEKAEQLAREKISFAPYVPLVRLSAKTGRGVGELFKTIDSVRDSFVKRISTGALNRFFEQVLATRPPPTMGGRAPRLYYITQAEASPPTFVIISNAPDAVHFSYRRFVVNQLRQHFGFVGVPLRVFYKEKRRGRPKRTSADASREAAASVDES